MIVNSILQILLEGEKNKTISNAHLGLGELVLDSFLNFYRKTASLQ